MSVETLDYAVDGTVLVNRFVRAIATPSTFGLAVVAGQECGVCVLLYGGGQGCVQFQGPCQVTAGATVNPGDRVTSDATGRAVTVASGGWGVVLVGATVGNLATVIQAAPASAGGGGPFVPPAGYVIQTVSAQTTVNITRTGSTAFATLLSAPITTSGPNRLNIRAKGAVSIGTANRQVKLRITVDAVSQGGVQSRSVAANIGFAFAIERTLVVAAGARAVLLEWAVEVTSSVVQCRPTTNIDGESASLVVQEVKV